MKIYISLFLVILSGTAWAAGAEYPWIKTYNPSDALAKRIAVPEGYERVKVPPNSFRFWLRHLPLKKENTEVYLYNREKKKNQSAHFSVLDIDTGTKDLQQCADAVIRLRAEYLYSTHCYEAVCFKLTNGEEAAFEKWIQGYRPVIKGNRIRWRKSGKTDASYPVFREYLEFVFMYAGTYSLSNELKALDIQDISVGDVFIKGGFPGHAIIVADMAENKSTGKRLFLLAQSYMPAQDLHILRNPENEELSPWYETDFGEKLRTPEWIFDKKELKRFDDADAVPEGLNRLRKAYPDVIASVSRNGLRWKDGTEMIFDDGIGNKEFETLLKSPDLEDQMSMAYPAGKSFRPPPEKNSDPGRVRYEPFFMKMYGNSAAAVSGKLAAVRWLPRTVNTLLKITTVNRVNEKLQAVSDELDALPDDLKKYLNPTAGSFYWRTVRGENRLSAHSFGMALDINVKYGNYWQWDADWSYKNQIPPEIAEIFEKHGFIWGGKWYHYDTVHFEYRPELLIK